MTNKTTFGKEMICCKCGLPQSICVCEEIELERLGLKKQKKENTDFIEKIKKVISDDFIYCESCGCHHYKNAHIKNKKEEE